MFSSFRKVEAGTKERFEVAARMSSDEDDDFDGMTLDEHIESYRNNLGGVLRQSSFNRDGDDDDGDDEEEKKRGFNDDGTGEGAAKFRAHSILEKKKRQSVGQSVNQSVSQSVSQTSFV
jgi:hypothetical protein